MAAAPFEAVYSGIADGLIYSPLAGNPISSLALLFNNKFQPIVYLVIVHVKATRTNKGKVKILNLDLFNKTVEKVRKRIEKNMAMIKTHKLTIILFIVIIMVINNSCSNAKSAESTGQWITTYGSVTGISKNLFIEYEVNGRFYKQRFYKGYYGMVSDGEKYELKYNPINASEIEICYSCPIFLPNENTKKMTGKITHVKWIGGGDYKYIIQYCYTVSGKHIVKSQGLPINYKELYPKLAKGQSYYIDVWVDNVYRAVLYLDQPVN